MSRTWGCLVLAVAVACGGDEEGTPEAATGAAQAVSSADAAPPAAEPAAADLATGSSAAIVWMDPEPPDAQARAEAVVDGPWNEDKTKRLTMHITSLVDTTRGIEGFASRLAAREVSVEERLKGLDAKVTEQEIVIRLPGSVLFDFDQADIRPDAERTLAEVAQVIAAYRDRPVRVEGHTDAIASDEYNQELSERRAESVKAWLATHGVAAARMTAVGRGESVPVADNGTAEGRQQNRRVEIVIGKAA